MIFHREFLRLLKDLEDSAKSGRLKEAELLDAKIWHTVQNTKVNPDDDINQQEVLGLIGMVALTLRKAGVYSLALRWFEQLCDLAAVFASSSPDTAWDFCHYAECLIECDQAEFARYQLDKALAVIEQLDQPSEILLQRFDYLDQMLKQ